MAEATLRSRILPEAQRRTLDELTADLDLRAGDRKSKESAFWTMLVLSAVIATAGVLSDSTATVIGAMIIAPLSTPIMGVALSIVKYERTSALFYVFFGGLLVVTVGALFSLGLPSSYDVNANAQIAGRTSPGLLDLIGAIATGLAGAVALARKDVAAVLPGVAIAISLVPPLAVVGVCLGQGEAWSAVGALLLFISNFLALVLAGTAVFAVLGYAGDVVEETGRSRSRAYGTIGILLALVSIPLVANTVVAYQISVWSDRIHQSADDWIDGVPEASVSDVDSSGTTFYIHVDSPGDLPPTDELLDRLEGRIPDTVVIVLDENTGREVELGTLGDR